MVSLSRPGKILPVLIVLGILLVLLICAAGCTQQTVNPPAPTPAQAGLPNPASVYCGQAGGTLEIEKDASGGEYGMCTFKNGTTCEEWALFRGEGCRAGVAAVTTTAPSAAPSAGMANPASVACVNAGGSLMIKKDASGGEYGMCTFKNGTTCEEWALFRGEGCRAGVATVTTTAGGKKMVTFTNADNGKTTDIAQGTKFAVQLSENPTTGFEWNASLTKGLELVSDNYQTKPHAEGVVGVGGTRTWVILAKNTGVQKFSATYRRSWEPVTGTETAYGVNVNVVKI
jgi:putative hemolysin/predicted secreted protein